MVWTSFILPRWLHTEAFSCEHGELGNSSLGLILVKTEGLDRVPTFDLQKIEDFNILLFPTLLNTEVDIAKWKIAVCKKQKTLFCS